MYISGRRPHRTAVLHCPFFRMSCQCGWCVYKRGELQHTHTYTHTSRLCAFWLFGGIAEGKPLVLAAGHYCSCEHKTQIWSCGICLLYLVHGCKVWPSWEMRASCWRWRATERCGCLRFCLFKVITIQNHFVIQIYCLHFWQYVFL